MKQQQVNVLIVLLLSFVAVILSAGVNHPLTPQQKNQIVQHHNTLRGQVQPPAANMQTMVWDDALEVIARDWSVQCQGSVILKHNDQRASTYTGSVGENIYGTTGQITDVNLNGAINLWFNEYVDYDFETNRCANGKVCGHYTQLVWASSNKIGCAITQCSNIQYGGTLICNYAPSGNWNGQKPYIKADVVASPSPIVVASSPAPEESPSVAKSSPLSPATSSKVEEPEQTPGPFSSDATRSTAAGFFLMSTISFILLMMW